MTDAEYPAVSTTEGDGSGQNSPHAPGGPGDVDNDDDLPERRRVARGDLTGCLCPYLPAQATSKSL